MKPLILSLLFVVSPIVAAEAGSASGVARLYRIKCAGCHGPSGEGGVGPALKGKLAHTSKQLFGVIRDGIPGTQMPASGLPDGMLKQMVVYVQHLSMKR